MRDQEEIKETEYETAPEDPDALEQQRSQRRRERMAIMRRKKRQQEIFRRWAPVAMAALAVLALIVWGIVRLTATMENGGSEPPGEESQASTGESDNQAGDVPFQETSENTSVQAAAGDEGTDGEADPQAENGNQTGADEQEEPPVTEPFSFLPQGTEHTAGFPEEGRGVYSTSGILIDVELQEIIAQRDPYVQISPASMTKILTLLVAAEHVTDLQDTFTITREITDYSFQHDCSNVGFDVGEVVTVEDLLYGTILPSGADAAVGLAEYVAGSHEAFVELMNEKLEQLGLSDSAHFTNCVGLYDAEHYCTVYDMAMILKAASDNELCRQVLSAHTYTTSSTAQHPEGLLISNWFLRRIEDKDTHGEVLCAKTGFVNQSGSCAASLATDGEGREYLCVTAGSSSSWACIYDQVEIYQAFLPENKEEASTQ